MTIHWSSAVERHGLRWHWSAVSYSGWERRSAGKAWTRRGAEAQCLAWLLSVGQLP